MQQHRFPTLADAIAAGYRTAAAGRDKDISSAGPYGDYGYKYQDEEGQKTVTVTLTEETNSMGHGPLHVAMFPPKPAN